MHRTGILVRLAGFLRRYVIAVALIATLAVALVQVEVSGVGPVPQYPPEGYTTVKTQVSLQWNKGTREEPITLQVSIDDPTFAAPVLEKKVGGTSHSMSKLEGGKTYYWRLMQSEQPSPVATFKVSKYNVHL
ncbi:MAG: hypothetical protein JRF63_08315 [Deltaproteobacteria bacterium]|nr:hypothetical protein [Deltaproteobacteria bacterium]